MATVRNQTLYLETPKERRALTSAARLEIMGYLQGFGECSVSDIAAGLGRAPDSLYYHLKILIHAGVIQESGSRKAGKRHETLYRMTHPRAGIPVRAESQATVVSLKKANSSLLRLTERAYQQALENPSILTEGDQRNFFCSRHKGRLTPQNLKKLNSLLEQIEALFHQAHNSRNGQLCTFTGVLVPETSKT